MQFEKLGRRIAVAGAVGLAAVIGGSGSWIARRRRLGSGPARSLGHRIAHGPDRARLRRDRPPGGADPRGEVSSRELVELYLERIERLDPRLNAFRIVFAERAREEADEADRRVLPGDERRCSACRSRSRTRSTSPAS